MEAKELRIGNYVCVTEKHTLKVKIINDEDEIMSTVSDNSPYITTASLLAFKPIPLTEEWLLKFGFENPLSSIFLNKSGWIISYEQHSFRWQTTPLEYVHQLQNLYFALTNEELIII
jgi:hypothetical protein